MLLSVVALTLFYETLRSFFNAERNESKAFTLNLSPKLGRVTLKFAPLLLILGKGVRGCNKIPQGGQILHLYNRSKRLFEKSLAVILIAFLPPLILPMYWGETRKSGSLPFLRGGLGWGKTLVNQLFKTCVYTVA